VPVTARLSKLFYDRLGEEIAAELVDWFNAVDATYRADLRELNELNFGRFDSRLGQRLAELEARLDKRTVELEARLEKRMTEVEAHVEKRMTELQAHVEKRMSELEARLDGRMTALDAKLDVRIAEVRADLIKWMFLFWAGTVLPLAGLIVALTG